MSVVLPSHTYFHFILLQAERALWAPGAIFAVLCIGVVVGMFFIPETSGVELPQTMAELSTFYKKNKRITIRVDGKGAFKNQLKEQIIHINNAKEHGETFDFKA